MRIVLILAKLAVTFVGILIASRLISWTNFVAQMHRINAPLFALAILISIIQIFVTAYRWQFIAHFLDPKVISRIPGWCFARAYYIAQLVGQGTPFVASDVIRIYFACSVGLRLRTSFKSVFLDRALALTILFAIALPFALFSPLMRATGPIYLLILSIITMSLVGTTIILATARLLARIDVKWRAVNLLIETLLDMRSLFSHGFVSLQLISLSFAVYLGSIIAFWVLARSQALPLSFIDAAAIVPIVLVVMMIPISIAGWGLRESFVVTLLVAAGINSESALILSLSFGTVLFFAALPGALCWLTPGPRTVQTINPALLS
jgi:glycosyltransferase 2 family protein